MCAANADLIVLVAFLMFAGVALRALGSLATETARLAEYSTARIVMCH